MIRFYLIRDAECVLNLLGTKTENQFASTRYSNKGVVIDNIIEAFYDACSRKEKSECDHLVLGLFRLWWQGIVDEIKEKKVLKNQLLHYILMVPNSWDASYFPTKEQFETSGLTSLFDKRHSFKIIYYSDAIIAFQVNPVDTPILKSGNHYIVLYFAELKTYINAYEIGRSIRGVKYMFDYGLVMHQSVFGISYNGLKEKIKMYLACDDDIEDILNYCSMTIYNMKEYDKNKYLLDIEVKTKLSRSTRKKLKSRQVKNSVICNIVNNRHITGTKRIDMSGFPSIDQCFILHKPIHGSTVKSIDITLQYKRLIKLYHECPVREKEKRSSKARKIKEHIKNLKSKKDEINYFTWREAPDTTQVVNDIYKGIFMTNGHIKILFRLYISYIQNHVHQLPL